MRVRSRRFCRITSCPAACGIRCVKPSSATTSPSRTSCSIAVRSGTRSATASEREGMRLADPDPVELGGLLDRRGATAAAPATVLHAAERHLWLVADRLVIDVDDPGLDPLREFEPS